MNVEGEWLCLQSLDVCLHQLLSEQLLIVVVAPSAELDERTRMKGMQTLSAELDGSTARIKGMQTSPGADWKATLPKLGVCCLGTRRVQGNESWNSTILQVSQWC